MRTATLIEVSKDGSAKILARGRFTDVRDEYVAAEAKGKSVELWSSSGRTKKSVALREEIKAAGIAALRPKAAPVEKADKVSKRK